MTRHIEARFEIASWDETPFEGGDEAPKLTEALVSNVTKETSRAPRRRSG